MQARGNKFSFKKPLIIFGTRPETIKMAPIIKKFQENNVQAINLSISQHVHMVKQVLKVFDIHVHHNLNIMQPNQTLFSITEKALRGFKNILSKMQPDIILVQGDTTSAFVGALSGFYSKIPVAHIEAGLRTYNKFSPYPEDINRRLIATLTDYHFSPTRSSANNLKHEGIDDRNIFITGNTVIDALLMIAKRKFNMASIQDPLLKRQISQINFQNKVVLITAHRRESFGKPFYQICAAIRALAEDHPNVEFIYPVHLNPNVQGPANKKLRSIRNIHLIKPLEYDVFVELMKRSYFILTDSGGIQEEAPSLGKPVLVMREVTERPEAVRAGTVELVGTDMKNIVQKANRLFSSRIKYIHMTRAINPYGDGHAAERIVSCLIGKSFKPFVAQT